VYIRLHDKLEAGKNHVEKDELFKIFHDLKHMAKKTFKLHKPFPIQFEMLIKRISSSHNKRGVGGED
jgi:hypothetical protein